MCGVYGYLTSESDNTLPRNQQDKRWEILLSLMRSNSARGRDSTGIALVTKKQCCILKDVADGVSFAQRKEVARGAKYMNAHCVVGHTRFATAGKVCKRNAHPFHIGRLVGAHNGVIRNAKEMYRDVEVDSLAAFRALDQYGVRGLERLDGSAVLTWFDFQKRKLRLFKHGNPLHAVYVPSLKTLFWSSEMWAIERALQKADVRGAYEVLLKADSVYSFQKASDVPIPTPINFGARAVTSGWWEEGYRYGR